MLEKKQTHMFRGGGVFVAALWFWNLIYMLMECYIAATRHDGVALAFALGFGFLFVVTDWVRKVENRRYDERYALREEALAKVKVDERL